MKNEVNKWITPSESEGWELWQSGKAGPTLVGVYDKLPSTGAHARFYVPVSTSITRVDSVFAAESDIEQSAAKMNLEVEFGEGLDVDAFKAFEAGEKSVYTGICIDALEAHKSWIKCSFDFAPRLYRAMDEILLVKEHGRWVMMCYLNGAVIHAQVIGKSRVEELISSHLVVVKTHLQMLGLRYQPQKILILSDGMTEVPGFHCERVQKTSLMQHPEKALSFIPLQIREWQRNKKAAQARVAVCAVLVMLALVGAAFMFWKRHELQQEIDGHQQVIDENQPMVDENNRHAAIMSDLEIVMNEDEGVLDYYLGVAQAIPSNRQVALTLLQISPGKLEVRGNAKTYPQGNVFRANLNKNKTFSYFQWEGKAPSQQGKTGFFKFVYNGKVKEEQQ